jgi:hypothetical protein
MSEQRRLAAILVADVVGHSKLIGRDEAGTLAQFQALRTGIIEPQLARHSGRLFKPVGDGFLIEFSSAVQAVSCAKAIQEANARSPLPLRIGIHVGEVVVQGDDLMGDGVLSPRDPNNFETWGGFALALIQAGRYSEAADAARRAVQQGPNSCQPGATSWRPSLMLDAAMRRARRLIGCSPFILA